MRLYIILGLTFLFTSCQQEDTKKTAQEQDIRIYKQAMRISDFGTALYATHSMLARDSGNTAWYDTLSVLYYNMRYYPQAIQCAEKAVLKNSNSQKLLELLATSYKVLGENQLALGYFRKLKEKTRNPSYGYEEAVILFTSGATQEADKQLDMLFQDPASPNTSIMITDEHGNSQKVPLIAALYNLKGFMLDSQGKTAAAKDNYLKALGIFPQFTQATANLKKLGNVTK